MRALIAIVCSCVCVGACGRVGFDARTDGDGGVAADGGVFVGATATYVKASNADEQDLFGSAIAMSADGRTLVVGAFGEASATAGVNGEQTSNGAPGSGAAYVFERGSGGWTQTAYLKSSTPRAGDSFGTAVAVSADGDTIAVGAIGEDSDATGVNGNINTGAQDAGAAYVFRRVNGAWQLEAYVKASNTGAGDGFGNAVALSGDGNRLVVGAPAEDSDGRGVGAAQGNNLATNSGAAYVYRRAGSAWSFDAYLKPFNTSAGDQFGDALAISADGATIAVGAYYEGSDETGIDASGQIDTAIAAGAVYTYFLRDTGWELQSYVKASNTTAGDQFGVSMALSANGRAMVIGAHLEDSSARGVDGEMIDDSSNNSGAAYLLERPSDTWMHRSYVKASNTSDDYNFGLRVAMAGAGDEIAVSSALEASGFPGVNADPTDTSMFGAGAAYVFGRAGATWQQRAFVKSIAPDADDNVTAIALSGDGRVLAFGAYKEDSAARGIGGDPDDDSARDSGAVYIYE